MKWILLPLLWLLALGVALLVLWRLYRGQNVVLRGRFGPAVVRRVVIILVMFGIGIDRGAADEPTRSANQGKIPSSSAPQEEDLPRQVDALLVGKWLSHEYPRSPFSRFKQRYTLIEQSPTAARANAALVQEITADLPPKFRAIVTAELLARIEQKPSPRVPGAELLATLRELEEAGYYDHFLSAYLFRLTAPSLREGITQRAQAEPLVQLYARLLDDVQLTSTLLRAQARVKPLMLRPRAWMSKAYDPSREPRSFSFVPRSVAEMVGACKGLYGTINLGTWERDGVIPLTVGKQSPSFNVLRRGGPALIAAGQALRVNRLELIETPAGDKPVLIENSWLGELRLPPGRLLSIWEMPRYLSPEARGKVAQTVAEALAGSEPAAERLEVHLPLVQSAVRESLAKQPQEKGAPRLRMILSLFDDTVMPPTVVTLSDGAAADGID